MHVSHSRSSPPPQVRYAAVHEATATATATARPSRQSGRIQFEQDHHPNPNLTAGPTSTAAPLSTDAFTMNSIMGGIDKKLLSLKQLFRGVDPLEEREKAAVKIQGQVHTHRSRHDEWCIVSL